MPKAKAADTAQERRRRAESVAKTRRKRRGWTPFAGPQLDAYLAARVVDVLGYGGAGGGGKTDLDLALAFLQHKRSIVYRRTIPQLAGLEERAKSIYGKRGRYNEQRKLWRLKRTCDHAGRKLPKSVDVLIQFASMNHLDDREKSRGVPFDGRIFDEAQNFLRDQIVFTMAWTRTDDPDQHCVDVLSFNPPTSPDGLWLIDFFGPWIDRQHPDPAAPGEVRWFITLPDGKEKEVDGPRDFRAVDFICPEPIVIEGREFIPRSRTFFPARVTDNPVYMATGYMAVLDSLPEPLRSQMRDGDFSAGIEDDAWQVIPTRWIQNAMARGRTAKRPIGMDGRPRPFNFVGVDPANGGDDLLAIAPRVDDWYAPVIAHPGKTIPDGATAAARLVEALDGAQTISPNIDAIGIGEGLKTALTMLSIDFNAINVSTPSYRTDKTGKLPFANLKAEIYWAMREALDPESVRQIALPDDRELLADLAAPRWSLTSEGIKIEPKAVTKKRAAVGLHKGEAVMLSNYVAPKAGRGELPPIGGETPANGLPHASKNFWRTR